MPPARRDASTLHRCAWAGDDPAMVRYHDDEWGTPSHDDRHLFEMLILEGAQAGLSWRTILRKREGYRSAFADFDVHAIARFDARRTAKLHVDERIVRNRMKIEATVKNARATIALVKEHGSLDAFVWSFVGGRPRVNLPASMGEVPARTAESDALAKALKARGFSFVGSTICYAFMQACGLVDDHVRTCFRAARVRPKPRPKR